MSLDVLNNPFSLQASIPGAMVQTVPQSSSIFTLRMISTEATASVESQATCKAIKQTLRDWQEIISDRFGTTRAQRQEAFKISLNQEKADADFKEDMQVVEDYKTVKSMIDKDVESIQKGGTKQRYIMLLTDSEARPQAIATIHEEVNSLYVNTIMSAPWNVTMHAEVSPEHAKLAVKRAGTTIMRQVYELALLRNKSTVELKPLTNSLSYYNNYLKMTPSADGKIYSYPVFPESLPAALQVTSGKLF
jgi:hypothetical protein